MHAGHAQENPLPDSCRAELSPHLHGCRFLQVALHACAVHGGGAEPSDYSGHVELRMRHLLPGMGEYVTDDVSVPGVGASLELCGTLPGIGF